MGARVEDLEVLKRFRLALIKFQEAANVALTDAESDLVRTQLWLDVEQTPHWNLQVRKATELLSRAEDQLRQKRVFKDATGGRQSTVDEEKAVKLARARLEAAQQKVLKVAQWKRRMEKVGHDYKGSVQRFASTVQSQVPATIAALEVMVRQLEAYVGLRPVEAASTAGPADAPAESSPSDAASMARGRIDEPAPPEEQSSPDAPAGGKGGG
jgi:hypothetical protein